MSSQTTPPPGRLTITAEFSDGLAVLALEGELDLASVGQVQEQLASAEARSAQRIVVDLDGLAFIDSTGLRTLIEADTSARERGAELWLRPGDPSIQRVFELTGTLGVLRFEDLDGHP